MSVTSVKERSNKSRMYTEDDTGKRTYKRVFVVQCSARTDGPVVIKASGLLPALGAAYTFSGDGTDTGALLKRYSFDPVSESDRIWDVTCEYDTETTDPNDDEGDDPLDWRPRFRQGIGVERRVLHVAYSEGTAFQDVPVANTAGDPPVPGLEYDQPYVIWWIERNETEHPDPGGTYVMTLNQSAFGAFPPGTVRMAGIGASREYHKAFAYWKITYELHFSPRAPFSLKIKSTGLREVGIDGVVSKVIDKKTNTAVTKPVYLKANGQKADGADDAETQTFWPYPFYDWSVLNLPNPYEPD